MFFETFSNRSVYSQLSDENVIVHFLPPILELCALQQQLLAGQLNVFVRCEKTYSLKPALHSPIYINIINVLYLAQILLLQFTIQKLSGFSFEKIIESMFFLIFCGLSV